VGRAGIAVLLNVRVLSMRWWMVVGSSAERLVGHGPCGLEKKTGLSPVQLFTPVLGGNHISLWY